MTDKELNTVRHLTEKFFNATLSASEEQALYSYAEELAGDNPSSLTSDPQLLNDLELIRSLKRHSEATLEALTLLTPPSLETTLENHISRLARTDRKKFFFKRAISLSSAAAILAAVATIGFKAYDQSGNEKPVAHTYATLSAPLNDQEIKTSETESPNLNTHSFNATEKSLTHPAAKASHAPKTRHALPSEPSLQTATAVLASVQEKIILPDFADPEINIMPLIAAASIDPSSVVMQPLSTISQTVCNVYESVDAVSMSFAGISDALDLVNSSLALVSPSSIDL
ncbi:MAG: hypothetical protein K2G52_08105 [Muribaculaceae bacterium]|nr:hypothetical protein [Muribaculaceae bacterium]